MANKTLSVILTQAQYDRFKSALQTIEQAETPPTDDQLVAQLKREATSITYAAEVGSGSGEGWLF